MDETEVTQLLMMHVMNGDHECDPVADNEFIMTMPDGEQFRVTVREVPE